jgi:hypothetical protein
MSFAVARNSDIEPPADAEPHPHLQVVEPEKPDKPRLRHEDARDLAAFFARESCREFEWPFMRWGVTGFQTGVDRSSFGQMRELLERRSGGSKRCPDCKGHGWVASKRHGWVASKRLRALRRGQPNDKERALLGLLDIWSQRCEAPAFDRMCERCKGMGHVERATKHRARGPITARPTGSSVAERFPCSSPAEGDGLYALSRARRKVVMLASRNLHAVGVLACYFDPNGKDLVSLWHLTASGKTMLRANPQGLRPHEFFGNLRNAQQETPQPTRAKQFEAADTQAQELLDTAIKAWVDIHG